MSNATIAAEVITRIRMLFQHASPEKTKQPLNNITLAALEILADLALAKQTRIYRDLGTDLPDVLVDAVEIQQVILNLVRNAIDAMQGLGPEHRTIRVHTSRSAQGVKLSVEDQGEGIKDIESIFEPFVSSKPSGMGIGLSVSKTIISNYAGHLWAENMATGARVSFVIPCETS